MNQQLLLFPMIFLILFTSGIGIALLAARYRAVRQDQLNPAYFRYNRGGKPPEYLLKISQHFDNLLETPLLFYLAVILIFVLNRADFWYLGLAWSYVALRLLHAWIHMGDNNILRRKNAFLVSYVALSSIWVRITYQLING